MTNREFRRIRIALGLTQAELAGVLGYEQALTISTYERETNPRNVPHHVAMLMVAFRDGYRPKGWPNG
jgi:transcriptional regulator with XRE-family HTH domain